MAKKIGELYWEIRAQTDKFEKGLTDSKSRMAQFRSGVNDVVQGLTGFNLSTISAVAGVVAVGNAVKQGIQEWQNYALSSKDASSALGVTVEDFTRLVQVADDARLSQEQLTTALQMMAKNGVAPSIENLAKLADELKGMSVTDRAAKLSELFGRNWKEVYKILDKGGAALKANTEAVAAGLVVTGQAADAAEDYYLALDNLKDSVTELKNSGLKELIPLLTGIIETTNGVTRANKEADSWWVKLAYSVPTLGLVLAALDGEFYRTRDANQAALDTARQMPDTMTAQAQSIAGLIPAAEGAAGAIENLNPKMDNLRAQSDKIAGSYRDMYSAQADLQAATEEFSDKVGGDLKSAMENAGLKGDKLREGLGILDTVLGTTYTPAYDLDKITKDLGTEFANGKITADEFRAKLQESVQPMKDLYQPIVDARVALQDMRGELEKLTGRVWKIAIEMGAPIPNVSPTGGGGNYGTYTPPNTTPSSGGGSYYDPLTGTVKRYANGGSYVIPGGYNENWPVGPGHYASSGETVTITPEGQAANSVTINVYGITDPKKVAETVMTELRRARRN